MKEMKITNRMRDNINQYLGYELIRKNEVGHHIYDEAPGLGKIGIEGKDLDDLVTNKQLDVNGNLEWFKNPNPLKRIDNIKPFHCKLTTLNAKKSKILIASLFPEETIGTGFSKEHEEEIKTLRQRLNVLKNSTQD